MFYRVLLIFICYITSCSAQEHAYYSGRTYGSEALYNPMTLILNGSYDIIQLDGHSRSVLDFPYRTATSNVLRNLTDPFGPIRRYGVGAFFRDQILPVNITKAGAQWWPNYQLHLIGGGMTYRAMTEWYQLHHVPSPDLFSLGTMAIYHLANEAIENQSYEGDNVDPIADIWVFDLGGIILFSSDAVSRWFRESLNLSDWSLQASFDLHDMTLQNNGQYFSVKWKLPLQERLHLFYYFGMNGLTGLSYKFSDGTAISAGAGLHAKNLVMVDPNTHQQTMDLVWNAGLFYDRENSLLVSLTVSGLTDNSADLNVYPGVLHAGKFSPGFWMELRQDKAVLLGLTTVWTPGIGVLTK